MSQKMASTLKPLRYYDTKMKNEKAKKQTTKKEKNKQKSKQTNRRRKNEQTNKCQIPLSAATRPS